jgi:hypothetical protein
VAAWPLGIGLFLAFVALEVGAVDPYGGRPLGHVWGPMLGATFFAAGLVGSGRWLRSEEPAEIPELLVTAPLEGQRSPVTGRGRTLAGIDSCRYSVVRTLARRDGGAP